MSTDYENPFITDYDYFDRKIKSMWFSGGGNGAEFRVHGEEAGTQGVWIAQGQCRGIYDTPVTTTWKTGAFQDGSKQKAKKVQQRDLEIGLHVTESYDPPRAAEENESEFRKIFDYEEDPWDDNPEPTTLHVETDVSGHRMLDLLLYENPLLESDTDAIEAQYFNLILKLRAGQPHWYEDPVIKTFKSTATDANGYIEIENPTDTPMRHKWILTRATKWTIPDVSWKGGKYRRQPGGVNKTRSIDMFPITDAQGGVVISLNQADLMVRDAHYTNCLPLLQGKFFQYVVPPYTPLQQLPISYVGAPAGGAMAQLVQPRLWSRPFGLE